MSHHGATYASMEIIRKCLHVCFMGFLWRAKNGGILSVCLRSVSHSPELSSSRCRLLDLTGQIVSIRVEVFVFTRQLECEKKSKDLSGNNVSIFTVNFRRLVLVWFSCIT